METILLPSRQIPINRDYQVVVAGAGPAGVTAALAAARQGANVLLLERYGFVGGNALMYLPLLGFLDRTGNQIIKGIAQEIVENLQAVGASDIHRICPFHYSYTTIDPEGWKSVVNDMLHRAGVDLLFHTVVGGAQVQDRNIEYLVVHNKSGTQAVAGEVFLDTTGDGDVAWHADVPVEKGSPGGEMQPPTLMFVVRGVDRDKLRQALVDHPEWYREFDMTPEHFLNNEQFIILGFQEEIRQARARGEFPLPIDRVIAITTLRKDEMAINMTRIPAVDGTNAQSLSRGEIEARRAIPIVLEFFRRNVPGFEKAVLSFSCHQIGLRETRRIIGQYVLTGEDIMESRRFSDVVAVGSYFIDVHHSRDDSFTLLFPERPYQIPYRCLLPRTIENLLVAGRCISTTREAMGAIRIMPTCMALGEAAGTAAGLAVSQKKSPSNIDIAQLQTLLRQQGAVLDLPQNQKEPQTAGLGRE